MGARRTTSGRLAFRRIMAFSRGDRASGITMSTATAAALIWANSAPGSYHRVWRVVPTVTGSLGLRLSLRDWINEGLITVFFALVGLELRREFSAGELA